MNIGKPTHNLMLIRTKTLNNYMYELGCRALNHDHFQPSNVWLIAARDLYRSVRLISNFSINRFYGNR